MNQFGKWIAAALCCGGLVCSTHLALAQAPLRDEALIAHRNSIERELETVAVIERKVMVPMRDGKRMQADIYRPKDESKKYPIIFVRTPYNSIIGTLTWERLATCRPNSQQSNTATLTWRLMNADATSPKANTTF